MHIVQQECLMAWQKPLHISILRSPSHFQSRRSRISAYGWTTVWYIVHLCLSYSRLQNYFSPTALNTTGSWSLSSMSITPPWFAGVVGLSHKREFDTTQRGLLPFSKWIGQILGDRSDSLSAKCSGCALLYHNSYLWSCLCKSSQNQNMTR